MLTGTDLLAKVQELASMDGQQTSQKHSSIQITLEKALELIEFKLGSEGWRVEHVKGNVYGDVRYNVRGSVHGDVHGDVWGDVHGDVWGDVRGDVRGTISGRQWKIIETPKDKLKRLIEEDADKGELLAALDQLEALPDD